MIEFRCESLGMRYPAQERWAIHDVSLEIRPGEVTWLSGKLGSGTSTFLLALAGLGPRLTGGDRRGRVLAGETDPATISPPLAGIAYLGPDPLLQLSGVAATVRQELAVGPMNLGRQAHLISAAVELALVRLGIESLADRAPGKLSGGETQRVLLAALLAGSPSAWLLDEPFSALDREGRDLVGELLRDLARQGHTVVVACDDADTMLPIADRLIEFEGGTPRRDGNPRELLPEQATAEPLPDITDLTWPPHHRPDGEAAVRFSDVGFAYRDGPEVLRGVSLEIFRGQATGLFGANGAGKTTLLRLAMALEQPTRGSVTTLGLATGGRHPEDLASAAGFLFQRPERQLFASSVRAECAMGARLAGWEANRIAAGTERTLAALGLEDVVDEHPYDLPVPRRRLVALASLLVTDPELLLLDEPTAGLDADSRERVIAVVRDAAARGKAVLAITHDVRFARQALDVGIHLEQGQVT